MAAHARLKNEFMDEKCHNLMSWLKFFSLGCGTVYELDHGYVDFAGKSTKYKAKVEVTCDDGYEIDGEDEIECGKDGKWTRTSCTGGRFIFYI